MSLRRYFKPVETLPSHKGLLSSVIHPEVIKEAVQSLAKAESKRGCYKKFTPEQQCSVTWECSSYSSILQGARRDKRSYTSRVEVKVSS